MKTLSILGCGWLGLAVAKSFKINHYLKVSTTTKNKLENFTKLGFESYLISEESQKSLESFLECHYLLIALPPSKFKDYTGFLKDILEHEKIQRIEKIIFISSTSVYDNQENEYVEESIILTPTNLLVYEAEVLVKSYCHVIFRCAGLMGYDRVAGKYFANKKVVNKNAPVNYVHQDDVAEAVHFVIDGNISGLFNLCAPLHPSKEEIYTHNALKYGFENPIFEEEKSDLQRVINGNKIKELGFTYKYENPKEFI